MTILNRFLDCARNDPDESGQAPSCCIVRECIVDNVAVPATRATQQRAASQSSTAKQPRMKASEKKNFVLVLLG